MIDRQSRILVISATSARDSEQQAERVIASIIADDVQREDGDAEMVEKGLIAWHISNRYYEADVHFRVAGSSLVNQTKSAASKKPLRRIQLRDAPAEEIGEGQRNDELDDQVRDVFAALQLHPAPRIDLERANPSSSESQELSKELEDVQAVILLVDREAGLSEHRRLLGELRVSGFDLAISLVIALPMPLEDDGMVVNLTGLEQKAQVEDMYAGEGWEYVDLAGFETQLETMTDDEEAGGAGLLVDEDEKVGVERVREALMMHTWPGLSRNTDRSRRLQHVGQEDVEPLSGLANLRREIDSIDRDSFAQPTAKDEELARAFLAQIHAAQAEGLCTADLGKSEVEMNVALQRFLEEEDSQWPGQLNEEMQGARNDDEAAWQTSRTVDPGEKMKDAGTAFEDDFTDFVGAGSTQFANDSGSSPDKGPWNGPADEEIDFLGDEDDALLLRAFKERSVERKPTTDGTDSNLHLDFESTLHAVMAHAERVRAIPDHEQRREEAARVALALLDH
jgi:hypothetical protein